ncbi:MAG TPA: PfkB family carbohydrate kinase [Trichocoleus sp.]|jgi:fructokinase
MSDVICLGELLIDFVPTVTGVTLIDAPAFQKAPGGAPANVAVGLSRLGISSAFMGKVGDDAFGHFLANILRDAGVNIQALHFATEARTALAFVSLKADGDREFMFYRHPSADMLFTPEEVDTDLIQQAKLLHFGSISLISSPSREATLHAIDCAQQAGKIISCDPNLRLALWQDEQAAREGMLLALKQAQIVKVSEEELEFLTGTTDPAAVYQQLWHDRMMLLLLTKGTQGCRFMTSHAEGEVPSFPVKAIDTTGAGDAFMAGFLQGIVKNPEILEDPAQLNQLCRFANAAGALTTTQRGAIPALPTRQQVDSFF